MTSEDYLQKNLEAFVGAIARKGKEGRKWVAFGVVVKDGSRRKKKPLITLDDARTSPNQTCGASARLVGLYSSCYVCNFVVLLLC